MSCCFAAVGAFVALGPDLFDDALARPPPSKGSRVSSRWQTSLLHLYLRISWYWTQEAASVVVTNVTQHVKWYIMAGIGAFFLRSGGHHSGSPSIPALLCLFTTSKFTNVVWHSGWVILHCWSRLFTFAVFDQFIHLCQCLKAVFAFSVTKMEFMTTAQNRQRI